MTLRKNSGKVARRTGVSARTVERDAVTAAAVEKLAEPLKKEWLAGELGATKAEVRELAKHDEPEQFRIVNTVRSGRATCAGCKPRLGPQQRVLRPRQLSTGRSNIIFARLTRSFDDRATVRGGQGPLHTACQDALGGAYRAWTNWKKAGAQAR